MDDESACHLDKKKPGEEAEQGRRCEQVAAEIDKYRLEMERTRSQERRQRYTVDESEEVRLEMERARSQERRQRWTVAES